MTRLIYGEVPYITDDEERLTEKDVDLLLSGMTDIDVRKYFNVVVTRVIPDKFKLISQIDQFFLRIFKFVAPLLGSRVLIGGKMR